TSPNLRMKSIGHWYRAKHSHVPQGWLRRMVPDLPDWPAGCTLFDYTGSDPDRTAQWLRWNEFAGHLTRVLLKVDRASMYESLEVRVPLLDLDVVRVAMRVDWKSCLDLRTGTGKLPLRRALARYAKHQTSAKRGFGVPMSEWLRGPLRSLLLDELGSRSDVLGVPLRRQHVAAFVDEHLRGATDRGWGIWILLSLALWERRHYRRWRS
ncbi:MAG TPA: asparagine synthase-related protein, partial [Chthonomonadales bacterium]|nr:asparagine synthase-related protein [Chthonomonadales bacterium]